MREQIGYFDRRISANLDEQVALMYAVFSIWDEMQLGGVGGVWKWRSDGFEPSSFREA